MNQQIAITLMPCVCKLNQASTDKERRGNLHISCFLTKLAQLFLR